MSRLAAWAPVPLTGQSSTTMPLAAQRSRISCFFANGSVLVSISTVPRFALATMPPLPKNAASTAATLGSEVTRMGQEPETAAAVTAG